MRLSRVHPFFREYVENVVKCVNMCTPNTTRRCKKLLKVYAIVLGRATISEFSSEMKISIVIYADTARLIYQGRRLCTRGFCARQDKPLRNAHHGGICEEMIREADIDSDRQTNYSGAAYLREGEFWVSSAFLLYLYSNLKCEMFCLEYYHHSPKAAWFLSLAFSLNCMGSTYLYSL